jgi:hypothetical protein
VRLSNYFEPKIKNYLLLIICPGYLFTRLSFCE